MVMGILTSLFVSNCYRRNRCCLTLMCTSSITKTFRSANTSMRMCLLLPVLLNVLNESFVSHILVWGHCPVGLNVMFRAVQLPEGIACVGACLAHMDADILMVHTSPPPIFYSYISPPLQSLEDQCREVNFTVCSRANQLTGNLRRISRTVLLPGLKWLWDMNSKWTFLKD